MSDPLGRVIVLGVLCVIIPGISGLWKGLAPKSHARAAAIINGIGKWETDWITGIGIAVIVALSPGILIVLYRVLSPH